MHGRHRRSRKHFLALAFACAIETPVALAGNHPAGAAMRPAWFQQETQKLCDALATGNKTPWDRALATDFIYTSEDGAVETRQEFMADIAPLPKGSTGGIKIEDMTVRDLGGGAVAHYLMNEWENVQGQKLHTKYYATDTYRRAGDSWQLVASQVTVVPRDLDPVSVDSAAWARLIGEYEVSPRARSRYHVFIGQGALYGGRDRRSATRLIPLSPLVYFQSGSIHTMVFVPGADGKIVELREIHKYNELVMTRVSAGP